MEVDASLIRGSAVEIRPGVFRPDFSTVTSSAAAAALRRDGVVVRHASHYGVIMARLLRIFVLILTVIGIALAGPVQANCAPPPAAAATPCGEMVMDEAPAHDQRPDAPAKACAIVQCPSALPTFAEVTPELELPAVLAVRQTISGSPARASADSAPEHRPPIS
jgi:hypothetical protein